MSSDTASPPTNITHIRQKLFELWPAALPDSIDMLASMLVELGEGQLSQVFESQHPVIAGTLNKLGEIAQRQDDLERGQKLMEQALAIAEHSLGPQHPTTQQISANLSDLNAQLKSSSPSSSTTTNGNKNDVTSNQYTIPGDMHVGDEIDARNSQGFVNQPSGPVNQSFGDNHTINTSGGDYAEGNIDKRQGVFVSGGTVYGPVIGTNTGEIKTDYRFGGERLMQQGSSVTLRDTRRAVRQAIDGASSRGDSSLASDLDEIEQNLSAAIQAEVSGNNAQRARKLRQVKDDLTDLATNKQELQELVKLIQKVS